MRPSILPYNQTHGNKAMPIDYTERVPLPSADSFNSGLICPTPSYMEQVLGWPRPGSQMTADCEPVTNPKLAARMVTVDVGPFRVTCLDLFAEVLKAVFAEVKAQEPALYEALATAGALCCRFIRGTHVPSNHSWGCAIDMEIGGVLVELGAAETLVGLLHLYGYMHKHGIYSGMGYKARKDSMHFEASEQLIESWRKAGKI